MEERVLIVPIRKFDIYSVRYSKEFTVELKKAHWITQENYVYYLGEKYSNEWVVVPRGYATDGATVPPALQGILPVFGKHGSAVILHDWLCEYGYVWHMNKDGSVTKRFLTRKEIDDVFLEALEVIEFNPATINLVAIGFMAHRAWSKPPVPNLDEHKYKLEQNLAREKGWVAFDASRLFDVVNAPPVWAYA